MTKIVFVKDFNTSFRSYFFFFCSLVSHLLKNHIYGIFFNAVYVASVIFDFLEYKQVICFSDGRREFFSEVSSLFDIVFIMGHCIRLRKEYTNIKSEKDIVDKFEKDVELLQNEFPNMFQLMTINKKNNPETFLFPTCGHCNCTPLVGYIKADFEMDLDEARKVFPRMK